MNTLWASCTRGADSPDLIVAGSTVWAFYMASLQTLQRFTSESSANLGFPSVKFMNADVVLDGGIGGNETATVMHFINTNYLHLRVHKDRNFVPLKPRSSVSQDAEVTILAAAMNLTCSGAQFQGKLLAD